MNTFLLAAKAGKTLRIKGTQRYFNVHVDEAGNISVSPAGGGLVQQPLDDSIFEIADIPKDYVKAVFSVDDDFIYEGYCQKHRRWNGWAMPVFEIPTAIAMMQVVNQEWSEWYSISHDPDTNNLTIYEKDYPDEPPQVIEPMTINVDGEDKTVLPFMSGNWTWSDHYGDEAIAMLAKKKDKDQE